MTTLATNEQIQQYADQRVRPHSELVRKLVLLLDDDRAAIDDVYAALTSVNPTSSWADLRGGGPPHLLAQGDILAFNTFVEDLRTYIKAHAQYPVILKACTQPPS